MNVVLRDVSSNRDRWLQLRKGTIGSSAVATIMGLNPWQSELELWAQMTEKIPPVDDTDFTWFGRQMEPIIGRLFTRKTGLETVPADVLVAHPVHNWATATPDFWVLYGTGNRILEAKTSRHRQQWNDGAPLHYLVQLNWQLGVCGVQNGYCAGLLGGDVEDFRSEEFSYSAPLFEECLTRAGEFLDFVRKDIPPLAGPGDSKLIETLQGERKAETIQLDTSSSITADAYEELSDRITLLRAELKKMETERDGHKARLLQLLGNKVRGVLPDGRIVEAKTVHCSERITPAYSYVRVAIRG